MGETSQMPIMKCYASIDPPNFKYDKSYFHSAVDIFIDDEGDYYGEAHEGLNNGKTLHGKPVFRVEKIVVPEVYNQAASTTYYGVAYNGISTGEIVHDPGGLTTSYKNTDKGLIVVKMGEGKFSVRGLKVTDFLFDEFHNDETFKRYYNGDSLVFFNPKVGTSNNIYYCQGIYDYDPSYQKHKGTSRDGLSSSASDLMNSFLKYHLPLSECETISKLLNRMILYAWQVKEKEAKALQKNVHSLNSQYDADKQEKIDKADAWFKLFLIFLGMCGFFFLLFGWDLIF